MSDHCCNSVLTLPAYKRGTTWHGLTDFTLSPSIDEALETVSAAFKLAGTTVITLTSGDGIAITDASGWIFDFSDAVLALTAKGLYSIEITTTDTTGFIRDFPPIFLPVT